MRTVSIFTKGGPHFNAYKHESHAVIPKDVSHVEISTDMSHLRISKDRPHI